MAARKDACATFASVFNGARILVAPLDWGLGHAARCVPIVRALISSGAVPLIGADGGPLELLKDEFPDLEHITLPGATVRYSRGKSQVWALLRQWPGLMRSIKRERMLMDRIVDEHRIAAVISDQRFGLHSTRVPCVIISHQIFPRTPLLEVLLQGWNLRKLERFDHVWIPDHTMAPGLAGELSHGTRLPAHALYIGPLSRMAPQEPSAVRGFICVAVLSGPEPQRALLEEKLIARLQGIPGRHLLIRGVPGSNGEKRIANVMVLDRVDDTTQLGEALCNADLIIARSGYSTIMDLHAIGRNALLIPTPGQPEQEYLATIHARSGRFLTQQQEAIDLEAALRHKFAHPDRTNNPGSSPGKAPQRRTNNPGSSPGQALEHALHDLAAMIHP